MTEPKPRPEIGVGQPGMVLLNAFGTWVIKAFDAVPYLVGSAARGKDWRDVDVRLILEDEVYDALFGKRALPVHADAKWALLCAALSALARQQTGLPVDFQIDRQTEANEKFGGHVRVPLGFWT